MELLETVKVTGDEGSARAERERSRELLEAAHRLKFEAEAFTREARLVLHADGAIAALRSIVGVPSSTPLAEVLTSAATREGVVQPTDAELLHARADLGALEALHTRWLDLAEAPLAPVREQARKRLVSTGLTAIAALFAIVLATWVVAALAKPKNLAKGKPWKTSSVGLECTPDAHRCGGTRTDIFFHTNNEPEPWFEVDLETPTAFTGLTLRNRSDMGAGRASPLVIEVSDDRAAWKQVVRRDEPFDVWEPRFPQTTARYVRLRVLKKTWFHLEAVEVHP